MSMLEILAVMGTSLVMILFGWAMGRNQSKDEK